jgi:hypothetical protein
MSNHLNPLLPLLRTAMDIHLHPPKEQHCPHYQGTMELVLDQVLTLGAEGLPARAALPLLQRPEAALMITAEMLEDLKPFCKKHSLGVKELCAKQGYLLMLFTQHDYAPDTEEAP